MHPTVRAVDEEEVVVVTRGHVGEEEVEGAGVGVDCVCGGWWMPLC